jgi:hypothetical protein
MTQGEKNIAIHIFQNKVLKANGNSYEELFTQVMQSANPNFIQVKPQGQLGDKKNDGFDPNKGIFYQVYAPENLSATENAAINKLHTDFNGLKNYWPTIGYQVKEFNYVVNNKYQGVGPGLLKNISDIQTKNPNIKINLFLNNHLQDVFEKLDETKVFDIIGYVPSADITMLELDVLHSVIEHIMNTKVDSSLPTIPNNPNFDKKIEFNGLSPEIANMMRMALINATSIDDYFSINNNFLRDELRNRFNGMYLSAKQSFSVADQIFADVYKQSIPRNSTQSHANAVMTLMAYYFECCDIFESPEQ